MPSTAPQIDGAEQDSKKDNKDNKDNKEGSGSWFDWLF